MHFLPRSADASPLRYNPACSRPHSDGTRGHGRAIRLAYRMSAPPRTHRYFRPLLEDVRRTAARWKEFVPFAWLRREQRERWLRVAGWVLLATLVVSAGVAAYTKSNTNVPRPVTTDARWEVRREGKTRIVYLTFPEFPRFAEEAVISERIAEYLETRNPERVRATMIVYFDFDRPRTKGPTLTIDGIEVDE